MPPKHSFRLSQILTFLVSTASFVILGLSCDRGVEPPAPQKVDLTLENASTTEVWLKLSFPESPTGGNFRLARDGNTVAQGQFKGADTTLVDDSLVAGKTYSYVASKLEAGAVVGSSSPLQVRTMDSTSHNFTWQTFTLGDGNSSILYDVAFVGDSIWAVGEIYLKDSTGQFEQERYNLAIWNGLNWKLEKLRYSGYPPTIKSIFVINSRDVWLDPWFHWDGNAFQEFSIDPVLMGVTVNRMWGDANGIYVVGNSGFIAYRSSSNRWQKIESGTDIDLVDAWGRSASNVWIAGLDQATGQRSVLLQWNGTGLRKAYEYQAPYQGERTDSITGVVTSVWTESSQNVWVVDGRRIWMCPSSTTGNGRLTWAPATTIGFLQAIRGSAFNNIIAAGHFSTIAHYNGVTWQLQLLDLSGSVVLESVGVKGKTTVAVGTSSGRAVAIYGSQQ